MFFHSTIEIEVTPQDFFIFQDKGRRKRINRTLLISRQKWQTRHGPCSYYDSPHIRNHRIQFECQPRFPSSKSIEYYLFLPCVIISWVMSKPASFLLLQSCCFLSFSFGSKEKRKGGAGLFFTMTCHCLRILKRKGRFCFCY